MTHGGGYQFPNYGSANSSGSDPYSSDDYSSHSNSSDAGQGRDPYASDAAAWSGPEFGSGTASAGQDPYAAPASPNQQPSHQFGSGFSQPVYAPAPPTSSNAIVGLVLGIASFAFCAGLTGPLGLIFSILGMRETGVNATQPKGGRGLAIAGLVVSILGCLVLLFALAYIVLVIVLAGTSATS